MSYRAVTPGKRPVVDLAMRLFTSLGYAAAIDVCRRSCWYGVIDEIKCIVLDDADSLSLS